jgi:hypothetical protein
MFAFAYTMTLKLSGLFITSTNNGKPIASFCLSVVRTFLVAKGRTVAYFKFGEIKDWQETF